MDVGYPLIDGHHKKLVSLINNLAQCLRSTPNEYKNSVGKVLKSLLDYTIYHFSEEEKVMGKYKYPGLAEHKAIHKEFVSKLQSSLLPLLQGNEIKTLDFYNFLYNWLLHHISVADKQWATYIHTNYPDAVIE